MSFKNNFLFSNFHSLKIGETNEKQILNQIQNSRLYLKNFQTIGLKRRQINLLIYIKDKVN